MIPIATFRDFVEHVKDVAESLTLRMQPASRDLSPMLFVNAAHLSAVAIDATSWNRQAGRALLVQDFIIPYVREQGAHMVALMTAGVELSTTQSSDVTAISAMDREVHEVWMAPINRAHGYAFLVGWRAWPANQATGRLLTPIQEALR